MGSSGYGFDITPIEGVKQSSATALYADVLKFLVNEWKQVLPKAYLKMAKDWILQGDDSLLTLGDPDEDPEDPPERVLFMYYETVDWPLALAQHWVDWALIEGKATFVALLKRHGYKVQNKDLPKRSSLDSRFIVVGRKIGQPDSDGVFWHYGETEFVEYEELPKATRAKAEAIKNKKAPCECPYCVKAASASASSGAEATTSEVAPATTSSRRSKK